MTRYWGTLIDGLFVFAFLVLAPRMVEYVHHAATADPNVYIHIALVAMILHPFACVAILQKIGTELVLQQGLYSMNQFLKRWYMWPLSIIVWGLAIPVHTIVMTDAMWNIAVRKVGGFEMIHNVPAFASFLFYALVMGPVFAVILGWKRIFKDAMFKPESPEMGIVGALMTLFFTVSGVSVLIVTVISGFCLYGVMWAVASVKVQNIIKGCSGRPINIALFKDTRITRVTAFLVLFIYTIIDAFYFDVAVSDIGSRFYQSAFDVPLAAVITIVVFYLPFRLFFALYSGKHWLGWATFALSMVIVYFRIVS